MQLMHACMESMCLPLGGGGLAAMGLGCGSVLLGSQSISTTGPTGQTGEREISFCLLSSGGCFLRPDV